jgi:hypothetical protein
VFAPGPVPPDGLTHRLRRFGGTLASDTGALERVVAYGRRPLDRAWYLRAGKARELAELGRSVSRTAPPITGPRVLVLSLRMWTHHTAYESVIAQALRLRGAEVAMLTCGGGQPICELGWGRRVAPRPCDRCGFFTDRVARGGGFTSMRLGDEFPWGRSPARAPENLAQSEGQDPSDDAPASVAWFLKSADPAGAPEGSAIAKDFRISVEAVEAAIRRVLDRFSPDVVFALNGLFAAESAVRSVGAERGVRVVTYEAAPRKGALVFGQGTPAPEMSMDGLAEDQLSRPLSIAESDALDEMLSGRVTAEAAHERYFDLEQSHEGEAVRRSLGIQPGQRVISAFTNLAWDTALLGHDVAYDSQFDWLAHASEVVGTEDDAVLVIRVHPAESRWGTAQPVEAELTRRVGTLPENVLLVPPDDSTSSYGLLAITDLALCYTTTVGLEAAVRGVSVAVGGRTHYRGRGFTNDIAARGDLERILRDPPTMSAEQVELARRYAFAFFFRRMIPFRHVRDEKGQVAGIPVSADELRPGRDPYLDFVCERILEGGEFFLPPSLALAERT